MSLILKLRQYQSAFSRIPKKYLVVGVGVLLLAFYGLVFREREMAYSYGGKTCDRQLIILPEVVSRGGANDYDLKTSGGVAVRGYPLWTTQICAQAKSAPQPGSTVASLSPFGGPFAKLSYKITTPELPKADGRVLKQPIAASRPLKVGLSEADKTFKYKIKAADAAADCQVGDAWLSCDIPKLALKQGAQYDLSLVRQFNGQLVDTVTSAKVKTLSPVTIVGSSIEPGSTVYDKPSEVAIQADKPLSKVKFSLQKLGEEAESIDIESRIDDHQAVVSWPEDLQREADYRLSATTFEAADGSTPLDDYQLDFKVSGGPKVTAVSVGDTGVDLNARVVISFDQELKPDQDIAKLVSVEGVPAAATLAGSQIFVQLNGASKCQDFTIKLSQDLISKHDVSAGSAWQRSQRTACHTTSLVGYSKNGRAITAYEFGNGSRTVLFVGAIHGNERSTYSLMSRWIQELEARAREIPADKKIVVVPQINPDGLARGSRLNANSVDLNRNFATGDWKKDITTVGNQPFPGGGGDSPLSEPESKALATLNDPRGSSRAGVKFAEVPAGGAFTLVISEAAELERRYAPGCSALYSCRVGPYVIINQDRWLDATPSWNAAGGGLRDYQHMVINHEIGHWLGHGHPTCAQPGSPAPVMLQQSIDLQGCTFNPWPLQSETWTSR